MKNMIGVCLLALALLLAGCGRQADRHPEWPEDWTRFGDLLAAETPEGFLPGEYNDALAVNGIWYAAWNCGPERTVVNDRGEEAAAFDAQLYLVLRECASEDEAAANVADWTEREAQRYETGAGRELTIGGQRFVCRELLSASADNPYSRGASAFAVRGSLAVSAELLCTETFSGDPTAALERFLNGFHYGE